MLCLYILEVQFRKFRQRQLGNGWSKFFQSWCGMSPYIGPSSHNISSDSNKLPASHRHRKLRPYVSTFFQHQSLYMWNYLHNTNISSSDKTSTHRRHANHTREVTRHSGLSNMLSKWWELLDQGLKSNLPSINKNLESSIINIDTYIIANFTLIAGLETFLLVLVPGFTLFLA